ncbi:hypothetical protein COOONC_22404, partial [Cooperia oncophora]
RSYYLIDYARRKYAISEPRTAFGRLLRSFAVGNENYQLLDAAPVKQSHVSQETRSLFKDAVALLFFFAGIQCTLVMMGFLQERIITKDYHNNNVDQVCVMGVFYKPVL